MANSTVFCLVTYIPVRVSIQGELNLNLICIPSFLTLYYESWNFQGHSANLAIFLHSSKYKLCTPLKSIVYKINNETNYWYTNYLSNFCCLLRVIQDQLVNVITAAIRIWIVQSTAPAKQKINQCMSLETLAANELLMHFFNIP